MKTPAKFVQIASDESGVVALDENGDVWVYIVKQGGTSYWSKFSMKRGGD